MGRQTQSERRANEVCAVYDQVASEMANFSKVIYVVFGARPFTPYDSTGRHARDHAMPRVVPGAESEFD